MAEFRRVGFANAQTTKIAEAAGVGHGTFFFHFPTKEHILLELQQRAQTRMSDQLRSRRGRPPSVKGFLRRVIDLIIVEEVAVSTELLRELLAVHVRRLLNVDAIPAPLVDVIAQFFRQASERGEVRTDLGPDELAGFFLAALFGVLLRRAESPKARKPDLQRVTDVFVRGIAP